MRKEFSFVVNVRDMAKGVKIAPYTRVDIYPHENKISFVAVVGTEPPLRFFVTSANDVVPGGYTVSGTEPGELGRLKIRLAHSKEFSRDPHITPMPTPQSVLDKHL